MADNVIEMNPSRIGLSKIGSRTVLTPKESITYQNYASLESRFNECVEERKYEMILDCKAVSFMDSEALELMLRMHNTLKNKGGMLKIISLNGVCKDIFTATRLINSLHVYEDIHEAIKSAI